MNSTQIIHNIKNGLKKTEITSQFPKDPPGYYDTVKEEIKNWKTYGLDKKSWVKCKNVYNVEDLRLYEKIGSMKGTDEFDRIVNRIDECI